METTINANNISIDCQICFETYNLKDIYPMVIDCGHTICNICLSSILSSNNLRKCPFCNYVLRFDFLNQYSVNYVFKDIIRTYLEKNRPLESYPNYKEKVYDEGKYFGQMKDNARNGYGLMKYYDNSTYLGNWHYNNREGNGKCLYIDKSEYDGEWKSDLPHGFGKFRYGNSSGKKCLILLIL